MGMANLIFGIVGGPLMLMIIAMSLQGQSGTHHVSPMNASLDQIRVALGWFVGALAFLVPIGIALVLVAHGPSSREAGSID